MKMRGTLAIMLVLAVAPSLAPFNLADEATSEEIPRNHRLPGQHTRPPRNLKRMADGHWTPWAPPATPAGQSVHTVATGDTLWGLSARYLTNPYLWPQIWDQNRYVLDSHWIYPGDPIQLPSPEVVPPVAAPVAAVMDQGDMDQGDIEGEQAEAAEGAGGAGAGASGAASTRTDVADKQDVFCAAYIQDEAAPDKGRIVGAEVESAMGLGQGDIVYLNTGSEDGIKAGDRFMILRNSGFVKHPTTGQRLGQRIDMMGQLTIIAVQQKAATAELIFTCEDIHRGDVIAPLREIPIPTIAKPMDSRIDRYNPEPSGGASGYIVLSKDPQTDLAEGNIVAVDLGQSSGVRPGDVLSIFRPNSQGRDLPRVNLGEAVVLMTEARTAVVRICTSVREIYLGDRVEVQ